MQKKLLVLSLSVLSMLLSASVFAVQATPTAPSYAGQVPPPKVPSQPCFAVMKACMDAGYTINNPTNKDLQKNCLEPLTHGQLVDGVKVAPDDVATCMQNIKAVQQQGGAQ
jgi:hypothetical protein